MVHESGDAVAHVGGVKIRPIACVAPILSVDELKEALHSRGGGGACLHTNARTLTSAILRKAVEANTNIR